MMKTSSVVAVIATLSLSAAIPTAPKRVCIFDIDQTLTNGESCPTLDANAVLDWPMQAIKRCQDLGYGIGIATARPAGPTGVKTPPKKIPEDVLPLDFYSTGGYQMATKYDTQIKTLGGYNKVKEITDVIQYYNVAPNCAVFFDDMIYNLEFLKNAPETKQVTLQRASDMPACDNQTVAGGWNSWPEREQCVHNGCGIRESEFNKAMDALLIACPDSI